ncbi:ATP-dependent 6-phosphofructokinase [Bacilli bacterium]|nr:ATP-dependent 6-phosphofructokinase [Bacilli bacterium]
MKIAILASGGNSPGMNSAIITLVKTAKVHKIDVLLINDGFKGLLEDKFILADIRYLEQFNSRGNVVIGAARSPEFMQDIYKKKAVAILKRRKVDVLIVIGGDGSYSGAASLTRYGVKVMALPGTIDNDVASTDSTIGFYTCLNTVVTAIDAIRDSFDSHSAICFVEIMGRGFSDLAIQAGVATEAEAIVTRDNILKADDFIKIANETFKRGKRSCIFAITEKIYGTNGIPPLDEIAEIVGQKTKRTTRVNVIGHIQRGGTVSAIDRFWASTMASHCIDCIASHRFNRAVGEVRRQIVDIDIHEAVQLPRKRNNVRLARLYEKINRI